MKFGGFFKVETGGVVQVRVGGMPTEMEIGK